MSRASGRRGGCVLPAPGWPVDLDRHPLGGGSRVDQVSPCGPTSAPPNPCMTPSRETCVMVVSFMVTGPFSLVWSSFGKTGPAHRSHRSPATVGDEFDRRQHRARRGERAEDVEESERGSTVRVRQRALKSPQTGIFVVWIGTTEHLLVKEGLDHSRPTALRRKRLNHAFAVAGRSGSSILGPSPGDSFPFLGRTQRARNTRCIRVGPEEKLELGGRGAEGLRDSHGCGDVTEGRQIARPGFA
jgi:hypothetical protein